jgi:hypothetical protein
MGRVINGHIPHWNWREAGNKKVFMSRGMAHFNLDQWIWDTKNDNRLNGIQQPVLDRTQPNPLKRYLSKFFQNIGFFDPWTETPG